MNTVPQISQISQIEVSINPNKIINITADCIKYPV